MRRCKTAFFLAFLCFSIAGALSGAEIAAEREAMFNAGNNFYEQGDFASAIAEYEKALGFGYESASLYFNLANAYYRGGELGEAILNYERARRLDPGDADIEANYRFVKARVVGAAVTPGGFWEWGPLKRYTEDFSVNGVMWMASALYVSALLCVFLSIIFRNSARRFIMIGMILLIGALANAFVAWHKIDRSGKEAVVLVPESEVHYGPSKSTTVFFKVREGVEVLVIDTKEKWYRVMREDGKTGWMSKKNLAII